MQLYALDDDESILAQEALRHKNYLCPECLNPLRLRGGPHKRSHFYHIRNNRLCSQHKKSLIHIALQMHLADKLGAAIERPFPQIGRIADVYWEKQHTVFEIQYSSISLREAKERIQDYSKLGIKLVWILHQRQFNKKNLSASEEYLRLKATCYFTNMNASGKGAIFDQFDILKKGRRLFKGNPLNIDLRLPSPMPPINGETPLVIKNRVGSWPLYFSGDLLAHFQSGHNFSAVYAAEKKFAMLEKPPSFSWRKLYQNLFHILLEKASH